MEALDKLIAKYELALEIKKGARDLAVSDITNTYLTAGILILTSVIDDLKAEKELLENIETRQRAIIEIDKSISRKNFNTNNIT